MKKILDTSPPHMVKGIHSSSILQDHFVSMTSPSDAFPPFSKLHRYIFIMTYSFMQMIPHDLFYTMYSPSPCQHLHYFSCTYDIISSSLTFPLSLIQLMMLPLFLTMAMFLSQLGVISLSFLL